MTDKNEILVLLDDMRLFADMVGQEHWDIYSNLCDLIDSAKDLTEKLLEEQELLTPTLSYSTYRCGHCGEIVGIAKIKNVSGYKDKFCHECGRKVKWDG